MWRRKKFIILVVLAATILLVGSISGVALAQTGTSDNTTPGKTLFARVATILGIDQQKVEDAFAQAQNEMRDEALDNYLNGLVAKGTITQEQADQYKGWQQSMPDMSQYRQQLKEWQQARPAAPALGPSGRFGGHGFPGGMKGGPFFWGR